MTPLQTRSAQHERPLLGANHHSQNCASRESIRAANLIVHSHICGAKNEIQWPFRENNVSQKKKIYPSTEYRRVYYSTTITPLFHLNSHRNTGIHNLQVLRFCKQTTRPPLVSENVYVSIGELQGHNQTAHDDSRCLRLGSILLAKRYASASVNPPRKRHTKYVEHPIELLLLFFFGAFSEVQCKSGVYVHLSSSLLFSSCILFTWWK